MIQLFKVPPELLNVNADSETKARLKRTSIHSLEDISQGDLLEVMPSQEEIEARREKIRKEEELKRQEKIRLEEEERSRKQEMERLIKEKEIEELKRQIREELMMEKEMSSMSLMEGKINKDDIVRAIREEVIHTMREEKLLNGFNGNQGSKNVLTDSKHKRNTSSPEEYFKSPVIQVNKALSPKKNNEFKQYFTPSSSSGDDRPSRVQGHRRTTSDKPISSQNQNSAQPSSPIRNENDVQIIPAHPTATARGHKVLTSDPKEIYDESDEAERRRSKANPNREKAFPTEPEYRKPLVSPLVPVENPFEADGTPFTPRKGGKVALFSPREERYARSRDYDEYNQFSHMPSPRYEYGRRHSEAPQEYYDRERVPHESYRYVSPGPVVAAPIMGRRAPHIEDARLRDVDRYKHYPNERDAYYEERYRDEYYMQQERLNYPPPRRSSMPLPPPSGDYYRGQDRYRPQEAHPMPSYSSSRLSPYHEDMYHARSSMERKMHPREGYQAPHRGGSYAEHGYYQHSYAHSPRDSRYSRYNSPHDDSGYERSSRPVVAPSTPIAKKWGRSDIQFEEADFGYPVVTNPRGWAVSFEISHSSSYGKSYAENAEGIGCWSGTGKRGLARLGCELDPLGALNGISGSQYAWLNSASSIFQQIKLPPGEYKLKVVVARPSAEVGSGSMLNLFSSAYSSGKNSSPLRQELLSTLVVHKSWACFESKILVLNGKENHVTFTFSASNTTANVGSSNTARVLIKQVLIYTRGSGSSGQSNVYV